MTTALAAQSSTSLADLLERILDRGLVINADITVALVGMELLNIRIRAAVASFETAARYGLEFPSGTQLRGPAWEETAQLRESCPSCGKRSPATTLLADGCPWCGWERPHRDRLSPAVTPLLGR